jgi:ABC-type nitrate/sulfonate/bicarbonate transport system substrate-binding protein
MARTSGLRIRARRRTIAVAAVAAAATIALAGCSTSAASSTPSASATAAGPEPTVTVGVFAGNLIAVQVADAEGYFAKEGVKVQFKTLQAGPAIAAAAEAGSIDIGYGDTLAWAAAVGNGFSDLNLVQGGTSAEPNLGSDEHILGAPGISSVKDLAGKKIGIIPYPEFNVATKLWLKKNGVDPSTVQFVTIQDGTQASLLSTGSVSAVEGRNIGEDQTLVSQSHAKDFGYVFGPIPKDTVNTAYFAKKSWLEKNKATAQKVTTAIREGATYLKTAPASTLATIATKYAGIDFAQLEKQFPGITKKTDFGRQTPPVFNKPAIAATNEWIKDAVAQGQITKAFDVTPYLWPTATAPNK